MEEKKQIVVSNQIKLTKEMAAVVAAGKNALSVADELEISGESDIATAAEYKEKNTKAINLISVFTRPSIKRLHDAHREALSEEKEFITPYEMANDVINGKIKVWSLEQRRLAEEKAKRERDRVEREEAARREELERRARIAEEKGNEMKAEQLRRDAELYIAPPVVVHDFPKTIRSESGAKVTHQSDLKITITDTGKALEFLLSKRPNINLDDIVTIKSSTLKRFLKLGGYKTGSVIPGIYIEDDFIIKS